MTAASPAARAPSGALVGGMHYTLACLFWGMNIPLTATLFKTFDPFALGFIRVGMAALILAIAVGLTLGASRFSSPIPIWRILVMGFFASSFFAMYNIGLRYTNTITAAAIIAGSPVYGAVVSRWMAGVRLEKGFWGAALLTIIGAGIAIYGRADISGQSVHLQGGEMLIVLGIACWTIYSMLSQRWFSPQTPQLQRTYLGLTAATPWLVLWWLVARVVGFSGPINLNPDATAIAYLLITAVFATALGGVMWNKGVARLGINAGMMWQNTVPVFAVLISLIFFGVMPLPEQVLGGVIVLAGVLYMQWHKLRRSAL
jgi:drug/metabolite transporter (DMT)-like permease